MLGSSAGIWYEDVAIVLVLSRTDFLHKCWHSQSSSSSCLVPAGCTNAAALTGCAVLCSWSDRDRVSVQRSILTAESQNVHYAFCRENMSIPYFCKKFH